MAETNMGRIFQINLSDGGVPKLAVWQAHLTSLGFSGDRQAHPHVHGGPERAVCLYSLEHILALQAEGHAVFPGAAGENLTLSGIDWAAVEPGTRLRVGGDVQLEVTRYTIPCTALIPYFKEGYFNRIHPAKHPGWARVYARVLQEGEIRVGDGVQIEG